MKYNSNFSLCYVLSKSIFNGRITVRSLGVTWNERSHKGDPLILSSSKTTQSPHPYPVFFSLAQQCQDNFLDETHGFYLDGIGLWVRLLIHPTWPTFLKLENHQSNLECRKNIFATLLVSVCWSDGELAAFFAKGKIILKEQIFEKVGQAWEKFILAFWEIWWMPFNPLFGICSAEKKLTAEKKMFQICAHSLRTIAKTLRAWFAYFQFFFNRPKPFL